MIAVRNTLKRPSMAAALAYLTGSGFELYGQCWLRGQRETALLTPLPSGRVSIRIGVSV